MKAIEPQFLFQAPLLDFPQFEIHLNSNISTSQLTITTRSGTGKILNWLYENALNWGYVAATEQTEESSPVE